MYQAFFVLSKGPGDEATDPSLHVLVIEITRSAVEREDLITRLSHPEMSALPSTCSYKCDIINTILGVTLHAK